MNTNKFAPKDARILREHPGESPEILLSLGLSKKAFERIKEQHAEEIPAATPTDILQPVKTEQAAPPADKQPTVVQMRNMRSGRIVRIGS